MTDTQNLQQDGIPLFRAEKVKPLLNFKGFWKNAKHYATTRKHAQIFLAEGCELTEEFLPNSAKVLDLTDKDGGDFVVNHYELKKTVPELGAAWDPLSVRFDLNVIKKMGYDAVKFNDALGVTIVK